MTEVSRRTAEQLRLVMGFFGIEDCNRHLFRYAAERDVGAFSVTVEALAQAIQADPRYGANERVRKTLAEQGITDGIDAQGYLKSTHLVIGSMSRREDGKASK